MRLTFLLAALLQLSHAFQLPATGVASCPCRAASPQMKHPEYFTRIARAEAGRLRLVVSKSNNHIYGQIVDDSKDAVIAAASTMEKEVREAGGSTRDCAAATEVGKRLAAKATAQGIEKVHFDRKSYKYHE